MTGRGTSIRLAVVEVTRFRAHDTAYHSYVDMLNSRVATEAAALGWTVTRIGAADVGTAELLALTETADAIVIMGGEDVAPKFYGGASRYPGQGRHYEAADEGQLALVRRALVRSTPLLGICRGHQVINVALGGTLHQDIGESTIHKNLRAPISQAMAGHDVELRAESALAASLGADAVTVQSAHHQTIDRLGDGLVVVGTAPDGSPEAVEHTTAPITGVQFHPEDPGAPADQLGLILEGLGARVAATRKQQNGPARLSA